MNGPRGTSHAGGADRGRRALLGAGVAALAAPMVARAQAAAPRVVVVGGGFAGAACARALKQGPLKIDVTLVERNAVYVACPMSNAVIAGLREIDAQRFSYSAVAAAGVTVLPAEAKAVDVQARHVALTDGSRLAYDRLVLAPGIGLRWGAIAGYDPEAAQQMPHAWQAGEQTLLLRRQLQTMDDGALVVIAIPANPSRCPIAPYERASLIAHYLQRNKPRSKLLLLDAKDTFPLQPLFTDAWRELYGGRVEWLGYSASGEVTSVEPATRTLVTDFERYRAGVANVIPPQKAGRIAEIAGVADRTGWCPVDAVTFESPLQPNVHVIGDAALAGALPKSATSACEQARCCALAVAALLGGRNASPGRLDNVCYSLLAPDHGVSVAGLYTPQDGQLTEVAGSARLSPREAPRAARALEAQAGEAWFKRLSTQVFG
jgi:NADPH-dependent 2,4-dienoyl-CoA reductase/sulfur reductase-like enzyme